MNISSIWLFLFIFTILYIIKIGFKFFRGVLNENLDISSLELLYFGLSLSYFLTYLIK